MSTIQKKIRNDEYGDFDLFQKDVELLVDNSKKYYETSDKEFVDGCALWAVFKKTIAKMASNASSSEDEDSQEEESEDEIPVPKQERVRKKSFI